jgi:hypothetical protein
MEHESIHVVKIFSDVVSVSFLVSIFIIIKVAGKPFKRGFDCNDFSVNMKFKDSTVTNTHLILVATLMPVLVLLATELARYLLHRFEMFNSSGVIIKNGLSSEPVGERNKPNYAVKVRLFGRDLFSVREEIFNLYINLGSFLFGLASTADITDFAKLVVGRLRPNFLGWFFIRL